MAQEITAIFGLAAQKGQLRDQFPQTTARIDMSGNHIIQNVQDITVNWVALNVAGQTFVPGFSVFTNTSSGSWIEIASQLSGTPFLHLGPLQSAGPMPLYSLSLYAKCSGTGANTAGLNYRIYER